MPITRIANCAPAVFGSLFVAYLGGEIGRRAGLGLALLAIPIGLVLCVRAHRMGVHLDGDRATIYGQFRTVTVRRGQIVRISGMPAVHWRDERGRRRWSPVIALSSTSRSLPVFQNHADSGALRLQKWAAKK